jgi:hypothetical protein
MAALLSFAFEGATKLKRLPSFVDNPIRKSLPKRLGPNYFTRLHRWRVMAENVVWPQHRSIWVPG